MIMATTKPNPADAQKAAAVPAVDGPTGSGFVTEEHSPFADGYSIAGEEAFLQQYMDEAGEVDEDDPMFDRWVELLERKDRIEQARREFEETKGAGRGVTRTEARGIDEIGSLVDDSADQMTIHTKEAYRMFMGRRYDPVNKNAAIVGGRRVASALRGLWTLTRNDNPYADWALVRHEQMIREVQKRLKRDTAQAEAQLKDLERKGLSFSVLKSSRPQVLNLGYRSPYGYAVSRLIVDYDYFVRLQKTLARKTLKSDDEARGAVSSVTRLVRRIFNETTRFSRWLLREEVMSLSRHDFLPDADEMSRKRVEFATGVFGTVPPEVFTAAIQPRHSRRWRQTTAAERKLLNDVAEQLADDEGEDETGLV